jgi:hypothetical protein
MLMKAGASYVPHSWHAGQSLSQVPLLHFSQLAHGGSQGIEELLLAGQSQLMMSLISWQLPSLQL